MDQDTPAGPGDAARRKRQPPTIDLDPSEVTDKTPPAETASSADTAATGEAPPEPSPDPSPAEPEPVTTGYGGGQNDDPSPASATAETASTQRPQTPPRPGLVAPALSGGLAAAAVIAVAWFAGWSFAGPDAAPSPIDNAAALDVVTARLARLEAAQPSSAAAAPAATDPALVGRIDALDKAVTTLREGAATLRKDITQLAASVEDIKNALRETASPPPPVDLSPLTNRIDQLDRAVADAAKRAAAPADDAPLRRMVVAGMLDAAVRQGDPYGAALGAGRALAQNPAGLAPLEPFAATGVPSIAALCRELLPLIPKSSAPAPKPAPADAGWLARLEANASRLIRIERDDDTSPAAGRDAVFARASAAAKRDDLASAVRELSTLSPAERGPVQPWLDKVEARDKALAASRQFAADSMSAFGTPVR